MTMANLSRIATLAQLRSDMFDDLHMVAEKGADFRRTGDLRSHDADKLEGRIHDNAAALAHVMLAEQPADAHDIASLMHCIADAADDLRDMTGSKSANMVEAARLASLIETAADNVVAFLAKSIEPRNDSERRRTAGMVQKAALIPFNQPKGE
ncbi:hypothetical protein [Sphingomonas sp. Leaf67]|uniref:hypothetical protein n=1 Tax=Sphingomonas sp. Leaf67 TaxID=1736230 RepID=UPI0012E23962|nr:hypothetical protein [Sphingomonas sp. Leaf67]